LSAGARSRSLPGRARSIRRPLVCNEFVRIGSAQLLSIKHPARRPLDRSDREPSISEVVNSEQSWQQQRFHPWNIDVAAHNANFPIVV
jgi:hypothetical protein